MRILHVINNLDGGGAERLMITLLPLLAKDAKVDLLLLFDNSQQNQYAQELIKKGVNVHYLHCTYGNYPSMIRSYYKFITAHHYDIIHAHLYPSIYLASLFKTVAAIPLVITEHGLTSRRNNNILFKTIDTLVYNMADAVVAISNGVYNHLLTKSISPWRIHTIPNAIDTPTKSFADRPTQVEVIGMAGRLDAPKNQEIIIKALPHLPQLQLKFAGVGPNQHTLMQLATRLGVQNRVEWLGFISPVSDFFSQLDIHVFASNQEGFGLAPLESMAMGLATLVSDIDTLREVCVDGAIYFDNENIDSLVSTIKRLQYDTDLMRQIRQKGMLRGAIFSPAKHAQSHLYLYSQLI